MSHCGFHLSIPPHLHRVQSYIHSVYKQIQTNTSGMAHGEINLTETQTCHCVNLASWLILLFITMMKDKGRKNTVRETCFFVPSLYLNLGMDYVTCYDLIPGLRDLLLFMPSIDGPH